MSTALRSPTFAHVAPLAIFLGFTALVPLIKLENPMLPWWRHSPEQWVYPLQTLAAGALMAWCWRQYAFAPLRGFGIATAFGVVGIVWWCLPAVMWQKLSAAGVTVPAWCGWLGIAERRDGFDAGFFREHTVWYAGALIMRFARLVVVVPFVEEIFWRGYLMRWVQADGGDFRRVPFGRHSWAAFAVTTAGFMLVHDSVDWLGALGFGALMYLLAVRTRSLAACVAMHAVANLLLGIYVMATGQWGFW